MRHLLLYVAAASAFKSSFINLGGVKHHVRDTGESEGPLCLFFHGFAGLASSFEDVAPLLAAKNVRCIGVDRVAFGLTERPSPASLPAPPKLPGSATLAASIEGGGGAQYLGGGLLPEAHAAVHEIKFSRRFRPRLNHGLHAIDATIDLCTGARRSRRGCGGPKRWRRAYPGRLPDSEATPTRPSSS